MVFIDDDEEAHDSRQILCDRCRKFVPLSDIKYVPKGADGRLALCRKCLAQFNIDAGKKNASASLGFAASKPSYFCSRCQYKFKYNPHSGSELRCPYCGKSDKIVENKNIDADSLIRNTDYE